MPLVTSIFNATMKSMGAEISNHLCGHFAYSRMDLFNIISVKKLKTFEEVMAEAGKVKDSVGCEACKPTIGSILASLFNRHVMDTDLHAVQDTNDRFLANIQRNGTFSVVPRVLGGEITPDRLIVIGQVAKKYGLYCKITGGQRIDLFGAKKGDLVEIWRELVEAGMESGHAYAKSLRTVKVCFFYVLRIVIGMDADFMDRVVWELPGAVSVSVTVSVWPSASRSDTRVSAPLTRSNPVSLVVSESVRKHKTRSKSTKTPP